MIAPLPLLSGGGEAPQDRCVVDETLDCANEAQKGSRKDPFGGPIVIDVIVKP